MCMILLLYFSEFSVPSVAFLILWFSYAQLRLVINLQQTRMSLNRAFLYLGHLPGMIQQWHLS